MALVIGTNCGFVTAAPTTDPDSGWYEPLDTYTTSAKFTSPAGAVKITEIGWWIGNATEAADFEMGVYDHNGGTDRPHNLLYGTSATAKGTSGGIWKSISVDWEIDASTVYWLALQLDNTATGTNTDWKSGEGRWAWDNNTTTLPDPFSVTSLGERLMAIYAVYEAEETGTNISLNVGDDFKDADEMELNIGDVWKNVEEVKINVGDDWKDVF